MHSRSCSVNVLMDPKYCTSLQKRTFILLFHHSDTDKGGKCCFQSDLKSQDCTLTHCLPMPGILAIIREVYWNQINCIYLKNQRRSVDFLLHLYNLHRIWNILEKKSTSQLKYFRNYSLRRTNSNTFVLQTKYFLLIFYCIVRIYIKF